MNEVLMPDKPKRDDPKQSERFLEAAKKAEASESEKEAERAVKKVIRKSAQSK
jgi:hypothetical protein